MKSVAGTEQGSVERSHGNNASSHRAILLGSSLVFFVVSLSYFLGVGTRPVTILYHVPIYPLVGFQLAHLGLRAWPSFARESLPWIVVFSVATILSILRETHGFPASGHVTWCVLLGCYVFCRQAPRLGSALFLGLIFCQVAGMKLFTEVHGDLSGLGYGLVVGGLLSAWPLLARRCPDEDPG